MSMLAAIVSATTSGGGKTTAIAVAAGVVVLIIVLAVMVSVVRRRRSGEEYSVRGYRQTLNTLEGLGSRRFEARPAPRPPSDARRVGGNRPQRLTELERTDATRELPLVHQQPAREQPAREQPSRRDLAQRVVPVPPSAPGHDRDRGSGTGSGTTTSDQTEDPGRHAAMVFDDGGRAGGPVTGPATEAVPPGGIGQRPSRRRSAVPITTGAVAIVVVVAAVVGWELSRGPSATPSTGRTANGGTHHEHHPPPTTTVPARYTAVDATASTATYAPATSSYSVQVGSTAGGRCWFSVTSADGTTVFAGTLSTGASKTLAMNGKTTMVVGAPSAAAISIGQVPLVIPAGAQAPFDVTLAPATP